MFPKYLIYQLPDLSLMMVGILWSCLQIRLKNIFNVFFLSLFDHLEVFALSLFDDARDTFIVIQKTVFIWISVRKN